MYPMFDVCAPLYLFACCTVIPGATIFEQPPLDPQGSCNEGEINTAIGCISTNQITSFVRDLFRFALGIGGGIALLLIIFAGFQITTSGGNAERLQSGKDLLIASISGLLLIIFSIFILELIGVRILGLPGF
jgi:hypothetical protein